jgi:hypothetical protein
MHTHLSLLAVGVVCVMSALVLTVTQILTPVVPALGCLVIYLTVAVCIILLVRKQPVQRQSTNPIRLVTDPILRLMLLYVGSGVFLYAEPWPAAGGWMIPWDSRSF